MLIPNPLCRLCPCGREAAEIHGRITSVRVSDPQLPTPAQVAAMQAFINRSQAPRRYRLVLQRTAVDLIGPETAPNPAETNGTSTPGGG